PRDITILVGKVTNKSKEDFSSNSIYIINSANGDTIQVLSANSETGKFGTNLPVGGTYKTVYTMNGKEYFSEEIAVAKGNKYQVVKREIEYLGQK
ncbi:MAG: hypothetical protein M3R27_13935, partial [Bacteroidota bacterium]|nr:hypothetical protein [Bacteroidota bacterium]